MSSEALNGLVTGLIVGVFFGGLAMIVLGLIAWNRRSRGKPAPMKPVWLRVIFGSIACVILYTAGYESFGAAALVTGAFAGYWSWTNEQ